jgi:vacuolar-type H+-ATPase subunit H
MKWVKRLAIGGAILFGILFLSAMILPFVFKDKIVDIAKTQINQQLDAVVDFSGVHLSLLRNFPNFTLGLRDLSVTGVGAFEDVTLARCEHLDMTLNLWSVLRASRPIALQSINLQKPQLHIYVLRDGTANYNIMKPSEEIPDEPEAPGADFTVQLRKYRISDGSLIYDDKSADTYVAIAGLNHSGSGNFTRDIFDLTTRTAIDELTVKYGGAAYLTRAETKLDATFQINQPQSKYTLKDNALTINALRLDADGYVQLIDDDIRLDLTFVAPQTDFKHLWSLIPNAYTKEYEQVKADGRFRLDGFVRGDYNAEREAYPAFAINLEVENGDVKYPDLPLGIGDIQAKAAINSPSSNFDDMIVDVSRLSLRIGDNPVSAVFRLKTPVSDPNLDASLKGKLDLRQLSQAFPMDGANELSGMLDADVRIKTLLSHIERQEYEKVDMNGAIALRDFRYIYAKYPPIVIERSQADFTPRRVQINRFQAKLGKGDVEASGHIDNILAYFSPKKTMTGAIALRSNFFDADEWYGGYQATSAAAVMDTSGAAAEVFDRFSFDLDAQVKEIVYSPYRLTDTYAKGKVAPNRIDVNDAFTLIGDSDVRVNGYISNVFDYLYDEGVLGGKLNLRSKKMNLNQFMGDSGGVSSSAGAEASEWETMLVPGNIHMSFLADIEQVVYTNMNLRNVKGGVHISDRAVILDNVDAEALGGRMVFSGRYDTQAADNPAFNFKFDLKRLDFQEAFNTINTFQALAPIGKFISGAFNTSLIMEGLLGKNMTPRLNSLSAEGFLETLNTAISNFKPFQEVGHQLNVDFLTEDWRLIDSRNWFEVRDGRMEVKEFNTKVRDIDMVIGGWHALNADMNYNIRAQIPRKVLEQNPIGRAAGTGLDFLRAEASKLGVNIAQSEFINVAINFSGAINQPKVAVRFLGADGEATLAESAEAQLRAEAEKQLERARELLEEKRDQIVDTARALVDEQLQRAKDEATRKAEELLREQSRQVTKGLEEEARTGVGTIIDSVAGKSARDIREDLERFNPFQRKKKEQEQQ